MSVIVRTYQSDRAVSLIEEALGGTQSNLSTGSYVAVGDAIDTDDQEGFLRGHGTHVVDGRLVATMCGVVERVNKLVFVRPLKSRYTAEQGDVVIGRVSERRRNAEDELNMRSFFREGDLISAEVQQVMGDGSIALHTRSFKYGKLNGGQCITVPANLVKRQKQHFYTMDAIGVDIILGCNGHLWVAPQFPKPQDGLSEVMVPEFTKIQLEAATRVANAIRALAKLYLTIYPATIMDTYEIATEHNVAPRDMLETDFLTLVVSSEALEVAYLALKGETASFEHALDNTSVGADVFSRLTALTALGARLSVEELLKVLSLFLDTSKKYCDLAQSQFSASSSIPARPTFLFLRFSAKHSLPAHTMLTLHQIMSLSELLLTVTSHYSLSNFHNLREEDLDVLDSTAHMLQPLCPLVYSWIGTWTRTLSSMGISKGPSQLPSLRSVKQVSKHVIGFCLLGTVGYFATRGVGLVALDCLLQANRLRPIAACRRCFSAAGCFWLPPLAGCRRENPGRDDLLETMIQLVTLIVGQLEEERGSKPSAGSAVCRVCLRKIGAGMRVVVCGNRLCSNNCFVCETPCFGRMRRAGYDKECCCCRQSMHAAKVVTLTKKEVDNFD
eukprot:gene7459-600_t